MKKLRVKYNNIKQQWRKLRDRQKHGSGLAPTKYPDWFEIINPVLSDTNQTMDNICSHPKDLSMTTENDRDDDDKTAPKYEETLSDLAPATQRYSSTEVVPKRLYRIQRSKQTCRIQISHRKHKLYRKCKRKRKREHEMYLLKKLSQNPTRKELWPDHNFKR